MAEIHPGPISCAVLSDLVVLADQFYPWTRKAWIAREWIRPRVILLVICLISIFIGVGLLSQPKTAWHHLQTLLLEISWLIGFSGQVFAICRISQEGKEPKYLKRGLWAIALAISVQFAGFLLSLWPDNIPSSNARSVTLVGACIFHLLTAVAPVAICVALTKPPTRLYLFTFIFVLLFVGVFIFCIFAILEHFTDELFYLGNTILETSVNVYIFLHKLYNRQSGGDIKADTQLDFVLSASLVSPDPVARSNILERIKSSHMETRGH